MTNDEPKQYYLMTKAEFDAAISAAIFYNTCPPECDAEAKELLVKWTKACLSRPAPLWAEWYANWACKKYERIEKV